MTDEAKVRALLAELYEPEEIERWLNDPHPQLDGKSAKDVIEAGRADLVFACIARLDADVYL